MTKDKQIKGLIKKLFKRLSNDIDYDQVKFWQHYKFECSFVVNEHDDKSELIIKQISLAEDNNKHYTIKSSVDGIKMEMQFVDFISSE